MEEEAGNTIIRSVRFELGLSQREMARLCSISAVYLCQVESGTYQLGREAGLKIWNRYQKEFESRGFTFKDLLTCSNGSRARDRQAGADSGCSGTA